MSSSFLSSSLSAAQNPIGALDYPRSQPARWNKHRSASSQHLRSRPRDQLFLHVGLHKTGTTAIQSALAANASALSDHALLYPASGRRDGSTAHHNIAWQVAGDRRFNPANGTLDHAAAEIADFAGTAMLSSEDFESIIGRPELLCSITHHEKFLRHDVTVLMYLREQIAYAESLFIEMQHHGLDCDAGQFLDTILLDGTLAFMDWRFHFDYLAVQQQMSRAGVARLVIRPYAALVARSSVADALHVLAPTAAARFAGVNPRLNIRSPLLQTLAQFCARGTGYDTSEAEARLSILLGAELTRRPAHLPRHRRRQFRDRFCAGNRTLAQAFGFPAATLDWPDAAPAQSLDMEALFSRRTVEIIGAWLHGHTTANQARAKLFAGPIACN